MAWLLLYYTWNEEINLLKEAENMRNLKGMAVLAGILMVFVMPAFAETSVADSVAVITDHSGTARIYTAGQWKNAEINMPLYEGDAVKTLNESALEVTFDDATIVKLGDNTELKLTELKRQGETATTVFNLLKGRFMAIVDKLKNPESRFEVHTKMAIAAVKGTELAVEAGDDGTNLGVYKGAVEFTGPNGGSVSAKYKVMVNYGNESNCGSSGMPGKPAMIKYMGKFEREFGGLRETIRVVRELKGQGGDAVYKWRIQKKLMKNGEKIGDSETEGTIGGTNANVNQVKNQIQKALKAKLKKEVLNEKNHAYRDLQFVNDQMKADLHLGKTMTDMHGNRIRMEEFIFRPADNQIDMLSITLRKGDRLDYLRLQNIFMYAIPEDITWARLGRIFQREWYGTRPENWLAEQSIKLSNIEDWVFMGTSYRADLYNGNISWKLLKDQDIVAIGSGDLAGGGEMNVANFAANSSQNNQYVKEQRMWGYVAAGGPDLLPSDALGNQNMYRGKLDKTYSTVANYEASMIKYGVAPVLVSGFVNYSQADTSADEAGTGDIAFKHTRNYNDGTKLAVNMYLINDYGKILEVPDFTKPWEKPWEQVFNIIFNSNVEVMAGFTAKNLAGELYNSGDIDVVSKLLWYLILNPKVASAVNPVSAINW